MIKVNITLSFSKIFALIIFLACFVIDMAYTKGFAAMSMAIPFCSAIIGVKQINDRLKIKKDENITEKDNRKEQ